MKKLFTIGAILLTIFSFGQCPTGQSELIVFIQQDNYPSEITWELTDVNANVIASGGNIGDTLCIDSAACVTFTIFDSYGDGICCGYGQGFYEIYLNDSLMATGGDYDFEESVVMNCPPGYSCDDAILVGLGSHIAEGGDSWFTFTPTANGSYGITTCGQGNTCDTKIWIYEYCSMSSFEEDNTATIYYDDNQGGCGEQAQLSVILLEQGVEYWIRIGDDLDSCAGTNINWTLTYNGPITGCTDPAACNFNPLAEVDDNSCIPLGDPSCPDGPDLIVLSSVISNSMYLSTITADNGNCYIPEGCLNGYGSRDILRFTTHIKNVGNTDYYIGTPSANPDQFDLVNCHNHAHYEGYAEYLLFDLQGTEIPIGFKNGFCVLDLECSDGGTAQYGCSNMGISAQCGDIYSSGLACQWIDITDTPDGIYTMVVRTNWDQDPDALGRHELDYDNNWAQVCIQLDRSSGSLVVTEVTDCDPYVDCAGNVYGSAQPDCTGNCNGSVITGDVNGDYQRNMSDSEEYAQLICDADIIAVSCTDLDADGEITVSDAAAMAHCIITDDNHVHPPGQLDMLDECEFPITMPTNPFEIVEFTITNFDAVAGYFDVSIKNPLTRVLAYELEFDGVNIASATNLINDGSFNITPVTGSSSKLIGMSYDGSSMEKYLDFTPLVRVYYSGTPATLCITDVVDVVTDDIENAVGVIYEPCGTCPEDITGNGIIDIDDFLALNSAYGNPCNDCPADLNDDGVVGVDDFLSLNSAYGQACYVFYGVNGGQHDLLTDLQQRPDLIIHPELIKVIDAMKEQRQMLIFPNPNSGNEVSLSISGLNRDQWGRMDVRVLDVSGKIIHLESLDLTDNASGRLNLVEKLSQGVYFVEAEMRGLEFSERLIVVGAR